jgi:two-component SAPR family response regulator
MSKQGPLILVDDDHEDQELMLHVLESIGCKNEVRTFNNAEAALKFLYETSDQPFMILSDINMPKMDGISFKKAIDACSFLKSKCIPFIFVSTSSRFVKDTCDLSVQGYFNKGNSLQDLDKTFRTILNYWHETKHVAAG